MANGRPLWFLGVVVVTWTGTRVVMLWPDAPPPAGVDKPPTVEARGTRPPIVAGVTSLPTAAPIERPTGTAIFTVRSTIIDRRRTNLVSPAGELAHLAAPDTPVSELEPKTPRTDPQVVATPPVVAGPDAPSRLHIDGWLVLRPTGGDTLAFGQLGASQGGARATYALDHGRRVALSARVSVPARGPGGEAGVGLDVRPTRLPLHLLLEQRVDLDSGATRPAATVIAGTSAALPGRLRADGYAQGGAVGRRGGFVDGALLVTRPLVERGATRVEVGAGGWGAAQRGVGRVDAGPSVALVTPGAGGTMRLQLDYRARLTGRARPGSGPALTLGGSF